MLYYRDPRENRVWLRVSFFILLNLAFITLCVYKAQASTWPKGANEYRKIWVSEWMRGGLHPEYRTWFLGQITQESRWNTNAVSPAGAMGIAQFMQGTAKLMEKAYGNQLRGLGGPYDPRWAFRAFLLLMRENVLAFKHAPERITRYRYAASAYNGGPGYLRRERNAAGGKWQWEEVRSFCRRFRSAASCKENIDYPEHALKYATQFIGF